MDIYKQGAILKSSIRPRYEPLFVMVCGGGAVAKSSNRITDYFKAVVILDCENGEPVGFIRDNWNKGKWELSSVAEINYYT